MDGNSSKFEGRSFEFVKFQAFRLKVESPSLQVEGCKAQVCKFGRCKVCKAQVSKVQGQGCKAQLCKVEKKINRENHPSHFGEKKQNT